jgi:hypothetical protein
MKIKRIAGEAGREYNMEAEWRQFTASSSPSPMQASSVSDPNMDAIRSISDDVGNSDFKGHSFNLAGGIVTGERPRNGASTEKDWPNMYLKLQFT